MKKIVSILLSLTIISGLTTSMTAFAATGRTTYFCENVIEGHTTNDTSASKDLFIYKNNTNGTAGQVTVTALNHNNTIDYDAQTVNVGDIEAEYPDVARGANGKELIKYTQGAGIGMLRLQNWIPKRTYKAGETVKIGMRVFLTDTYANTTAATTSDVSTIKTRLLFCVGTGNQESFTSNQMDDIATNKWVTVTRTVTLTAAQATTLNGGNVGIRFDFAGQSGNTSGIANKAFAGTVFFDDVFFLEVTDETTSDFTGWAQNIDANGSLTLQKGGAAANGQMVFTSVGTPAAIEGYAFPDSSYKMTTVADVSGSYPAAKVGHSETDRVIKVTQNGNMFMSRMTNAVAQGTFKAGEVVEVSFDVFLAEPKSSPKATSTDNTIKTVTGRIALRNGNSDVAWDDVEIPVGRWTTVTKRFRITSDQTAVHGFRFDFKGSATSAASFDKPFAGVIFFDGDWSLENITEEHNTMDEVYVKDKAEKNVKVSFVGTNPGQNATTAIVAAFDVNDILLQTKILSIAPGSDEYKAALTLENVDDCNKVKLFLWENSGNLKPLQNLLTFDLKSTVDAAGWSMAKLESDVHRNVPTAFAKSSNLNDLLYFEEEKEDQDALYTSVKGNGEVVYSADEFINGIRDNSSTYGNYSVVDVSGQTFPKALRIQCTSVPDVTSDFIVKTSVAADAVAGDDIMLLSFAFRLIDGGDSKNQGKVAVQVEESGTNTKALWDYAYADTEWQRIYLPFKGIDNATSIGIRPGFCEQTVEIGGFELLNFGSSADISTLPYKTNLKLPELEPDAEWRSEALDRIESIRKGDFTVIVEDSEGNIIPDAEVTFDMFEHEFEFGTAVQSSIVSNNTYLEKLNRQFNSMVVEHQMQWAPWEENRQLAIDRVEAGKTAGMKKFRGHSLVWQTDVGTDGKTWLTPEYMYSDEVLTDRDLFDELVKGHIDDIAGYFKGRMDDWDVINEIFGMTKMQDVYGTDMYKQWFDWARAAAGEDCDLYYNEATTAYFQPGYIDVVENLVNMGVDMDGIGLQSHCENLQQPSEYMALYDALEKYGKKLKTTEYSCNIDDQALQGNYTRDFMITMFAEEDMDGFLMWGFWDGNIYGGNGPMYTRDWQLKPAGQVYEDLVYNKWWTRDANATTDANGKAAIRGFYGDYDVTVSANGKTKTVSCAYHKGYDNVMVVTLD